MTIIERARTIRDGLDAGDSVQEVRGDIDALIADVDLLNVGDFEVCPGDMLYVAGGHTVTPR